MRKHRDGNANDQLGDEDLLDREASERREFMRLERREPHLRDTTYQGLTASRGLLHAWTRWSRTSMETRLRGLLPKQS